MKIGLEIGSYFMNEKNIREGRQKSAVIVKHVAHRFKVVPRLVFAQVGDLVVSVSGVGERFSQSM